MGSKRHVAGALVALAALSGLLIASPQSEVKPVVGQEVTEEVRHPDLSPFLERAFDDLGLVPGMAVAVVRNAEVILLQGFGVTDVSSRSPVTPDTPFYIASSTKSFTGTAAATLQERGTWSLDDPVGRWIPSLRLPRPLSPEVISIRDLLTHTSRIENDPIVYRTAFSGEHDRETLIELLADSEVLDPGFDYGNIGYVVTSLAMDEAAGMPWQDVLDRELFEPLGMSRTSARRSDFEGQVMALPHGLALGSRLFEIRPYIKHDSNMHAAGGMITTAGDLARWLEANLNEGRVDDRQALPSTAVQEAHRLQASTEAKFYDFERTGYGLGWYHSRYEDALVIHHFGNYPGFRAHVSFMPESDIGVAVLTNESAQGYYIPEMVATWVYDRLLEKSGLEAKYDSVMGFLRDDAARVRSAVARDARQRTTRPDSLALPFAFYTGAYEHPAGGTLRIDDPGVGRLRVEIGVLSSFMEPIDDTSTLRVELIPGSGEVAEFFLGDNRADSVRYGGLVFRRR